LKLLCPKAGIPGGKNGFLCQFSEACYRAMHALPLQLAKERITVIQTALDRNDVILLLPVRTAYR